LAFLRAHATRSHIVELAVVRLDATGEPQELHLVLDPGPISDADWLWAKHSGLSPADVEGSPCFSDIAEEVHALLDGATVVGHAVGREAGHLAQEFSRIDVDFHPEVIDLAALAKQVFSERSDYSLAGLARDLRVPRFGGQGLLADVHAIIGLFGLLIFADAVRNRDARWPWRRGVAP
jgi:DNA polymerase III epsilon subunit-like protein